MDVTFWHALLHSDELCCPFDQSGVAVTGATKAANMRWREAVRVPLFFPPLHLDPINPTASVKFYQGGQRGEEVKCYEDLYLQYNSKKS